MVKKKGGKSSKSFSSDKLDRINARLKKHDDMLLQMQVGFAEVNELLDFLAKEMKKYEKIMGRIAELDTLVKTVDEVKSQVRIINDNKKFVEEIGNKLEGIYIDLDKRFKTLKLNEDDIYKIQKRIQDLGIDIEKVVDKTKEAPRLSDFRKHVIEVKADVAKELNDLKLNVKRMIGLADEDNLRELKDGIAELHGRMNKELGDIKFKMADLEKPVHTEMPEDIKLLRDVHKLIKKVESCKDKKEAEEAYKKAYETYEKLREGSKMELSIVFKKLTDAYDRIR